jgi:hypothetical protein
MVRGVEQLPAIFLRLFDASHFGTMLLTPD